jgi:hypothetical protein
VKTGDAKTGDKKTGAFVIGDGPRYDMLFSPALLPRLARALNALKGHINLVS